MKTLKTSKAPAVKHSKIGASSMERWENCPGSVALSEGIPKTTSKYAEEGSKAHEVAALHLETKPYNEEDYTEEMCEAAQFYAETIWSDAETDENHTLLVEHSFDLKSIYPGLYGTADAVLYTPSNKLLRVIDFKYGAGIQVEVANNSQLLYYALGALVTTDFLVEEVELVIIQPRIDHPDGKVRRFRFDTLEILDFEAKLIEAVKRTAEPNAPLKSGEWCRFCPANGICPKLREEAALALSEEFEVIKGYDERKLAEALNLIPKVEAWAKAVHEFAYSEAQNGRTPPGYKLVAKRSTRKWKDENETIKFISKNFKNLKSEDIFKTELKSVTQLEKVLSKEDKNKIANLIESVSSGETLVHESDPRPAVIPISAADEFEVLN